MVEPYETGVQNLGSVGVVKEDARQIARAHPDEQEGQGKLLWRFRCPTCEEYARSDCSERLRSLSTASRFHPGSS